MSSKSKIILGAAVAAAALIAIALVNGSGEYKGEPSGALYAKVEKGPLVISVSETGSIKPSEQIILKSKVEGRVSILYLIPEGTHVKEGDLLVELDSSDLETKKLDQEIVVQNAQSDTVIKRENLEIVKNQAKADVDLAEQDLRFANDDLKKYREGEFPNTLKTLEGKVTLAEEEMERARDKLEWSRKLYDEKYLSETELKSDELSWKSSSLSLETARGDLQLLKDYTYKRDIAKLESDVSQKTMALDRTRRKANSSIVQAEAEVKAKELELTRQVERLGKFTNQIANAKIKAPVDGLVIYATSAKNNWGNQEPLKEGMEVWERQELIYLPTADTFNAEVDLHESNLKKVHPGDKVKVRVNAAHGRVFEGEVIQVSPLADPQRTWMNSDLKVYKTVIRINGGADILKSGMNCTAEIIVEQFGDDTLQIPVQCVVMVNEKPTVWARAKSRGEAKPREIRIGPDNDRFVQVISGLEVGEEVMLAPPLAESVAKGSAK